MRAQRRHEAKAARTARRYAGWNSLASVEHAALAGVSHRTADHESFDSESEVAGTDTETGMLSGHFTSPCVHASL